MSDVWAHCPECDRWFYPTQSAHEVGSLGAPDAEPAAGEVLTADWDAPDAPASARCPVCSVQADRVEDRDPDTPQDPQRVLTARATA